MEKDVGADCCGLCPFFSAVWAEGSVSVGTVAEGSEDSLGAGEDAGAGDDCFDNGCCLDFSTPGFNGGVSLFLREGSSFCGAELALGLDSEIGPLTGLRGSFFSDSLYFFLSFFPLPCFWRNIFEGIHCKF